MKRAAVIPLFLAFLICAKASANDAKPDTAIASASQPVAAPTAPADGVKQPTDAKEAVEASKDLVDALKGRRWWFAAAGGIFLLLLILGRIGVWTKIGTVWAWVAVGVLSLAAGCFAAFDSKGFNWGAFLGYLTAGPTIAWARDWIKDGMLKLKKKE